MVKSTTVLSTRQSAPTVSQALAEHERLVEWVVCHQWLGNLPRTEALHVGRIAVWRAVRGYDPARGWAFSTYAVPAITHSIWRAVRLANPRFQEVLMPQPPRRLPDLDDWAERSLVYQALSQLVARLPEPYQTVILARYGLDGRVPQTFAAIGHSLSLTRQRVHQLHVEALLWLAYPGHCLVLRQRLERNTLADYRRYLAQQRAWQRFRSGRR